MYNFYNIFNSNLILLKYFYYSKTKKNIFYARNSNYYIPSFIITYPLF